MRCVVLCKVTCFQPSQTDGTAGNCSLRSNAHRRRFSPGPADGGNVLLPRSRGLHVTVLCLWVGRLGRLPGRKQDQHPAASAPHDTAVAPSDWTFSLGRCNFNCATMIDDNRRRVFDLVSFKGRRTHTVFANPETR
jgi:hypothetical protein